MFFLPFGKRNHTHHPVLMKHDFNSPPQSSHGLRFAATLRGLSALLLFYGRFHAAGSSQRRRRGTRYQAKLRVSELLAAHSRRHKKLNELMKMRTEIINYRTFDGSEASGSRQPTENQRNKPTKTPLFCCHPRTPGSTFLLVLHLSSTEKAVRARALARWCKTCVKYP